MRFPEDLRSHHAGLSAAPAEHTLSACSDILANWEFHRRWIRPVLGPTIPLPLTQLVFAEDGASVHTVMIGGRIVFQGGQLLTLDESVLRRQAQEAANRLDQANAGKYASGATVARLLSARMHRPHAATKARTDLRRLIAPLPPAPSRTMR